LFPWLQGPHALDDAIVVGADEQGDGGHRRVEPRQVWCPSGLDGVVACERWPGFTSVVMVTSPRHINGQDEGEQRYDSSALPGATDAEAKRWHGVLRPHWEMENRGQWVLDVAMAEATNRTRQGDRAQHLALLRKLALNLLRRETSVKTGFSAKQKRAGWDHNYLLKILAQT